MPATDFPSFLEGLSLRRRLVVLSDRRRVDFPSFLEGLSLRPVSRRWLSSSHTGFPFLFGGAFIEASATSRLLQRAKSHFPSFLEGLSLRRYRDQGAGGGYRAFPFLFGGAFIEAIDSAKTDSSDEEISLPFWRGFH